MQIFISRSGVQNSNVETDQYHFLAALKTSNNLPEQSLYKGNSILFLDFPKNLNRKYLINLFTTLEPCIFSK